MATECNIVKKEPADTSDRSENGSRPDPPDKDGPEFVNIKMEIEIEPDAEFNIKSEPIDDIDSEPSLEPPLQDNEVASSQEGRVEVEILPDNCLEVSIKVEPDDDPVAKKHYANAGSHDLLASQQAASSLDADGNRYNPEEGYLCPVCHKRFANPGNVQRHLLLHAERKFACPQCPKQYATQTHLDKHIEKHINKPIKTYICEHCNKSFKNSSNLMQHKRVHLEVKPYFCTQCHRTFAFKANLTKHQGKSRCKRPVDEPITCHICNKTFEKEFLLKSHLRRHETERPYACEQCPMKFKYKSTLIRHIQLHNGVRPYACPYCEKSFTHSGLLKPHIRVHTGEKPYKCPICPKAFAHKHNMQRHALRHSKIKHLVCDVCNKKFPKESRLKYHMKTHVNEKHFSCFICPKKFSHKQNVLRHYSRKHPNAKYECADTDASVALKVWDTFKSKYSEDPGEILG